MQRLFHRGGFRLALVLIWGILVWPVVLWSQDDMKGSGPGLTASLDRNSAKVGSVVVLTLSFRLPEGAELLIPPEIKGLEGFTRIDHEIVPGKIRIRLLIDQLDSWKTGPLSLTYKDKEGETQILTSNPVSLTVLSNLGESPDEAQLRPIYGIIPIKSLWSKSLPWIAGGLCVFILGLGLVWMYRRRRGQGLPVSAEAPPHVRAKAEIAALEAERLFEKGYFKAYYFRFSEILRHYLAGIRGFPAAEFTTQEIALYLDREQDRKLLPLLRHADLVKFADALPTQAQKEEEVEKALSYIRETSPAQGTENSANNTRGIAR
jgi:hypothetical protein